MNGIKVAIVVLALGGCSSRVAGGLDETRANETMTWLEDHGIAASKSLESGSGEARFAVEVPRSDLGEALSLLHASGLPRQDDPGIAETYAESSLVPSASEERARHEAAIAGELARTLERIDGVVDARVHLAVPERDPLAIDDAPSPARASVLLTTRGRVAADDEAIAALVAGAVDELSPGAVSVVTVPARGIARTTRLARLGPFRVAPSSVRPLALLLGVSLGIHVAMAALYLVFARRRSRGLEPLGIVTDA